jgi:hypothetical protein
VTPSKNKQLKQKTNQYEEEVKEMKRLILFFITVMLLGLSILANAECISGNCQNGSGVFVYSNGSKYEGQWQDGLPHGQGTMINGYSRHDSTDGAVYVGSWLNGLRSGQGTVRWADGSVYVGSFENDTLNGYGVCTWANGQKQSGFWKDGKFDHQ